jgi:hypothetical protein
MRTIEYAVDIWDLRGVDRRLDSRVLHDHLLDFGAEGWELVWIGANEELADQAGPCRILVFKRIAET